MSSPPKMIKKSAVTPCKTMRGHTNSVYGVAHLPCGQRIITCSFDGSLRIWDLQNGAQIGDEWRDEGDEAGVHVMALSPNGKNIASGSSDGTVRLWDVETGKVVHKWKAHPKWVKSVCWRPDGQRVVSGSRDGTARVWDAKSGEPVHGLNPIKTGQQYVFAVSYSPEAKMIATGGWNKLKGIEMWDAKTGKLLSTIKLDRPVRSLAWTSDENKLIAGSFGGSIRIFDTATWQQIAVLDGHAGVPVSLTLFHNDRLLASTSYDDGTARLWNLDTNLQVGPPLQHKRTVSCAAFSADGKLLSTACRDKNAYVWDIQAILKAAGLEDLLSDVSKSLSNANATRRPPIRPTPRRVPQGFFDDVQDYDPFSTVRRHHPNPSLHRRRRVSALSWGSRPRALLTRLLRLFRHSQPNADEPIELQQRPLGPGISSHRSPPVIQVPALDDKKALYVAWRPKPAGHSAEHIKNSKWWARVVLFICCVSPSADDVH